MYIYYDVETNEVISPKEIINRVNNIVPFGCDNICDNCKNFDESLCTKIENSTEAFKFYKNYTKSKIEEYKKVEII